jgi:YidC/Oxa1 family membrane protein insertase
MQIFDKLLIEPIVNILVAFYHLLSFANIPYALGFSIVLMTVFIRLLMYPLTTKQLQVSKKMQDLAPHLSKIKEKHKGDMKRQQEATMALYKEHSVNPAAGCLPGLVQIVVLLFGLYPALLKILTLSGKDVVATVNHMVYLPALKISAPWDTSFLGLSLGQTPGQMFATIGPIILLVPVLTAVFQFVQSKMMIPAKDPNALTIKSEKKQDDFATTFQKQSLYLLPAMIGFFSWNFSIGLSLYWNTFTIFGIIQQYKVAGLGGAGEWVEKLRNKK